MPESLTPFAFEEQLVRCRLDEHGEPWFVAKDVALALGYQWNGASRIAHVPEEWRRVTSVVTLRGDEQNMQLLSEQGLYFFVARSDKPKALPFQKWLAGEVLPSLRRTGGYAMPGHEARAADGIPDIPEMYALRPVQRQRLWQDALQTARLDNGGSAAAVRWFALLCRMVTARPVGEDEPGRECAARILRFADEECRRDAGGRINASRLYEAFALWWCARFADGVPPIHVFGRVMPARFAKVKRGGRTWYLGLSLTR